MIDPIIGPAGVWRRADVSRHEYTVEMPDGLVITVMALGSAAEALGWSEKSVVVAGEARLGSLIAQLEHVCPRLAEARNRVRWAVNRQYATPLSPLQNGDEVAIVPPVSGGASHGARLTREPINVPNLLHEVESDSIGAIATFLGVVRAETNRAGQALRALDYSAYDEMAEAELGRLAESAEATFDVHRVLLVHRLGVLGIGEASVAIVVSAPHRASALDACRWLIEELKARVPIFKRELWEDGKTSWVQGI